MKSVVLKVSSDFFFFSFLLLGYCFHPWCPDGPAEGLEKVCPGCISETW